MKDLCVLTADPSMRAAIRVLLNERQASLGIHKIECTIERHVLGDPGCRLGAADRLRAYAHDHCYALVMFDRDGSGRENEPRLTLQAEVERQLSANGWPGRSKAIVIDPELEAWIWTTSPHTAGVLGWGDEGNAGLRNWLQDRHLWPQAAIKPPDPKDAMATAMREKNKRPTSDVFAELAKKVGIRRCQDAAFIELRETLQAWFPSGVEPA